jgi:hypothetical protein
MRREITMAQQPLPDEPAPRCGLWSPRLPVSSARMPVSPEPSSLFPSHSAAAAGVPRLYRPLILPKYLAAASADKRLHEAAQLSHEILVKWADLESKGKLAKANESKLESEFITQVFGQALHYSVRSGGQTQWEFQPKFAVPEGTADAAIGFFTDGPADAARCLVELKGPKINVDRDRSRGQTPVQQLWGYLNSLPDCPWGIVCNFVSFRLYHHQHARQQFEIFTLQELRGFDRFLEFYVLFERNGLLPSPIGEPPRALELVKKTESALKTVGARLYDDYHANRLKLIDHLVKSKGKTVDEAIHIAQKLMDRIVFVAFCQCRQLLPKTSLYEAAHSYSRFDDVTNPRWQNFVKFFRAIDKGNSEAEIPAYNGGLFARDGQVDDLNLLADTWTGFFEEIGRYDFESEVTVDVLGRIFERSVTDLESIRLAAVTEGAVNPPGNGKRKREGIYYTPPRITAYIVEQAAGTVLAEKFAALAEAHGITPDIEPTPKKLADWLAYQNGRLDVLRKFRIVDPACGSGAFLIAAFDYLEDVYEEVLAALMLRQGLPQDQADAIKQGILSNNLFGVDVSAESVEITQLALWLRTAERGKKLSDLSANIRRGNSLVDDPAVDPLAFDWKTNFKSVFDDGGFDCVVGNPPYVKLQNFRKFNPAVAAYLPRRYQAASTGNFDLYLPFIERGIELLNPAGMLGFIAPSVWLFNEYGAGLRQLTADRRSLSKFDDFKSFQVFEDATTYTALQFFRKSPQEQIVVSDVSQGTAHLRTAKRFQVASAQLGTDAWALLPGEQQSVLAALRANSVTLEETSGGIFVGVQTSADDIYHLTKIQPGKYYSKQLSSVVAVEDAIMKPIASGEDVLPFTPPSPSAFILFPYLSEAADGALLMSEAHLATNFPKAWAYLRANEKTLRAREDGKLDVNSWWQFGRNQSIEKQNKIKLLVPRLLLTLKAAIDPVGGVCIDNVDVGGVIAGTGWDIHYLLGILNSAACGYAWMLTSKPFRGDYRSANKQFIAPLPVPNVKPPAQKPVAKLAEELAELYGKREQIVRQVRRRLATDLTPAGPLAGSMLPPSLPGKLRDFHSLEMKPLLDAMQDFAGVKFNPAVRESWQQYLSGPIDAVQALDDQIAASRVKLDHLVYGLYGMTPQDIQIIEDATKSQNSRSATSS